MYVVTPAASDKEKKRKNSESWTGNSEGWMGKTLPALFTMVGKNHIW